MKSKSPNSAKKKVASRRRSPRPGRGTLVAIAVLLLGSAFLRLGNDAGRAFAKQSMGEHVQDQELVPNASETKDCASAPEFSEMLSAFQAREKRIAERESQISARLQALSVADGEISRRMVELTQAESDLRATLALADSAAENDIGRLTAVYENMKPKDAAALFEEMDPEFSAGFLARMRPEAAASIMSGLPPQTAYSISAILAGRNAKVPKE
jgi:flagellar motility protein MotE (MotC chaperone)